MKRICLYSVLCFTLLYLYGCATHKQDIPVVGFVDAFEDATIARAKQGFVDALKENGFDEGQHTVKILFRNAQGDIPTLTHIVNYFVSEKVDLIAANTTLAAITAIQRSKEIPVFMMVSAQPAQMKVLDRNGNVPANLFGVGETLDYIDSSFALIPAYVKPKGAKVVVGMIYNQSEPQSQEALQRARVMAQKHDVRLEVMPINSSSDAQLITQSLLNRGIDAFFANPDNVVFASFETILKNCNAKGVPVFTSEAGLVKRGAVAAYGADIYQWGYQSGVQAARYLAQKNAEGLYPELVQVRKLVYNPAVAEQFHFDFPHSFEPVK